MTTKLHVADGAEYMYAPRDITVLSRSGQGVKYNLPANTVMQVMRRLDGTLVQLVSPHSPYRVYSTDRHFGEVIAGLVPVERVPEGIPLYRDIERHILGRTLNNLGLDEDCSIILLAMRDSGMLGDEHITELLRKLCARDEALTRDALRQLFAAVFSPRG